MRLWQPPSPAHHGLNPDEAIHAPHGEQFIHLTHTIFSHILNPDEAIRSSLPPDDAVSHTSSPRNFHEDIPMFDDPLLDEPFEDLLLAQSPARSESPLAEVSIHPLLNGAYTVIISCPSW